ncbi:MAG: hypothetical protein JOY76_05870, partial [Hyphomicrobiales bacterium]|nr:hypothetical protein [Hyphomicrobiales bacterium]
MSVGGFGAFEKGIALALRLGLGRALNIRRQRRQDDDHRSRRKEIRT